MTRFRKVLVGLGLLVLLAAGWLLTQYRAAPAPYHYEPQAVAAGAPLAADGAAPAALQTVRLVANDDQKVLAEFDVAHTAHGLVRMDWRAQVDDPLLQLSAPLAEVQSLAEVLARHQATGTPLLTWWDTGRQLQVLGVKQVVFDQHLA